MKRLTIRNSDGTVSQPTSTTIEEVFYKLAAYEDLGMEWEDLYKIALAAKEGRLTIKDRPWRTTCGSCKHFECKLGTTMGECLHPKKNKEGRPNRLFYRCYPACKKYYEERSFKNADSVNPPVFGHTTIHLVPPKLF